MIQARFSAVKDGLQLEVKGHATGSKVVCAGVSAITYALAGWMSGQHDPDMAVHLRAGDAWLQCRRDAASETAFAVAEVGMRQIEKKYPELIRVEVTGK